MTKNIIVYSSSSKIRTGIIYAYVIRYNTKFSVKSSVFFFVPRLALLALTIQIKLPSKQMFERCFFAKKGKVLLYIDLITFICY